MKNGFMKILMMYLVILLFGVKPGFAASPELQNKLLDAIKANNPKQVELMIKSGANVNEVFEKSAHSPMLEALINLEQYANKSITLRILGSAALFLNAILPAMKAVDNSKLAFESHKAIGADILNKIDSLKTQGIIEIYDKLEKKEPLTDDEYILYEEAGRLITQGKAFEKDPKGYKNDLQFSVIANFIGMVLTIGASIGLGAITKKLYDNIQKAANIALIIENVPGFIPDKASIDFIAQKLPKYAQKFSKTK